MPELRNATAYSLPAAVGGINAQVPLFNMAETDAIYMENLFPEGTQLSLRAGSRVHTTGGMNGAPVRSLFEYTAANGDKKLIACANNAIYDCSTYNTTATSLATGFGTDKFESTQFNNLLLLVNGVDTPQQYNGTAVSAATYTGSGLTATNLTHITNYKGRVYLVEKDTGNIWYTAVDTATGAVTKFPTITLLRKGGYVMWCGSWTKASGAGDTDLFIIGTNNGEILCYSGDYPGGNWNLQNRFFLPPPLGRRAFVNIGADLAIITQEGVIPLSDVLASQGDNLTNYGKISDRLGSLWRDATINYASNFGWSALVYPKGPYILFNVPITTDNKFNQFVINTETKAWTTFTGWNGVSWALFNDLPYFGGKDGKIYQAEYGASDAGNYIYVSLRQAFTACQDPERTKRFTLARPTISGDSATQFVFGLDVDYQNRIISDTITVSGNPGSPWNTSPWNTSPWNTSNAYGREWYGVSGMGKTASVKLQGSFKDLSFSLSSFTLIYERGGLL